MSSAFTNVIPINHLSRSVSEDGISMEMEAYEATKFESIPLIIQPAVQPELQSAQPIVQPVPILPPHHPHPHHSPTLPAPSQSPQRDVVDISSSLTINNVNRFRAVAKTRKNIMLLAKKNRSNQLAMHALKHTGSETPECILMKDHQIQVLDAHETKGMLRRIHGSH